MFACSSLSVAQNFDKLVFYLAKITYLVKYDGISFKSAASVWYPLRKPRYDNKVMDKTVEQAKLSTQFNKISVRF